MSMFSIEKAVDFKKAIDAVAVLIDEAEFLLSARGLSLKATDPSQISMVDFELGSKSFKAFKVEGDERLGVDLQYLSKIMSRCKAGEELTAEHLAKEASLKLTFKGKGTRKFSLPLIDISASELPNPKIDFDATVRLQAEILQDGLKDAQLVGNHVIIGVNEKEFFVRAESSKGKIHTLLTQKDKSLVELKARSECSSMFPLDYLNDMVKGAAPDTVIELKIKTDAPIGLSYEIGDARLSYFLAPRIETQ